MFCSFRYRMLICSWRDLIISLVVKYNITINTLDYPQAKGFPDDL